MKLDKVTGVVLACFLFIGIIFAALKCGHYAAQKTEKVSAPPVIEEVKPVEAGTAK